MASATDTVKKNFNAPVFFSALAALAAFGGITYFAVKSGVKPLQTAAKVVKG